MKKKCMKIAVCVFIFTGFSFWASLLSAEEVKTRHILAEKSVHSFPAVFEGEKLIHTFTISNRGKADLEIKKVTHS